MKSMALMPFSKLLPTEASLSCRVWWPIWKLKEVQKVHEKGKDHLRQFIFLLYHRCRLTMQGNRHASSSSGVCDSHAFHAGLI